VVPPCVRPCSASTPAPSHARRPQRPVAPSPTPASAHCCNRTSAVCSPSTPPRCWWWLRPHHRRTTTTTCPSGGCVLPFTRGELGFGRYMQPCADCLYTIHQVLRIAGDGRCLFRSVAQGAAVRTSSQARPGPYPRSLRRTSLKDKILAHLPDEATYMGLHKLISHPAALIHPRKLYPYAADFPDLKPGALTPLIHEYLPDAQWYSPMAHTEQRSHGRQRPLRPCGAHTKRSHDHILEIHRLPPAHP
jgi:hypothetical protein